MLCAQHVNGCIRFFHFHNQNNISTVCQWTVDMVTICPPPVVSCQSVLICQVRFQFPRRTVEFKTKVIRRFAKISKSRRRPLLLLGPSLFWKRPSTGHLWLCDSKTSRNHLQPSFQALLRSLTVWPMWEQVVRVGWLAVWCPVWPGLVWRLSFLLKIRCLNQCNRRAVLAGRAAKEDTFLDFNLVIFPK